MIISGRIFTRQLQHIVNHMIIYDDVKKIEHFDYLNIMFLIKYNIICHLFS